MSMRFESIFGDDNPEYFDDDDFHDYDERVGEYQADFDEERDIDFDDFIDNYEE